VYIESLSAENNTIVGNYIGTDVTGNNPIGNNVGVEIRNSASSNTIGGNLISGNKLDGVLLEDAGVAGNAVQGNKIGTNYQDTIAIPNENGVAVSTGAKNNEIGASVAAGANVISGNSYAGIELTSTSTNTVVQGNYIGTNLTTVLAIPNDYGIVIDGSSTKNTIGGPGAKFSNVISGNTSDGIDLFGTGTSGNVIQGNYIGTNAGGTAAIPNNCGVVLDGGVKNAVIGGLKTGDGNIISGNTSEGVVIQAPGTSANSIEDNTIGLGANGSALPNAIGVLIQSSATMNLLVGNVVSGNTEYGVEILDSGTTGNKLHGNFIGTNNAGTAAAGNGEGILIAVSATGNIVGGSGFGNTIGGNQTGVDIEGSGTKGNLVEGNLIGLNKASTPIGNGNGVVIGSGASQNTIGGGSNVNFMNIISGNTNDGVDITGSGTTSNTVADNSIGTNIAQTAAVANGYGVAIENGASVNLIGGNTPDDGNLISGNGTGVLIQDTNTTLNSVEFNFIGTDFTGTVALGNGVGVSILNGAVNNVIGVPQSGNLISGNTEYGVEIFGDGTSNNVVQSNLIGVDTSSKVSLANAAGVLISFGATNNVIGGTKALTGNTISGNRTFGVEIAQPWTSGNVVEQNRIGLDFTADSAVANGVGVVLLNGASYNTIGGVNAGNNISGNTSDGVVIEGNGTTFNSVQGNQIGFPIVGSNIGNGQNGVLVSNNASNNLIGGVSPGEGNLISYNGEAGVFIGGLLGDEASQPAGPGNAVLSNSISGNTGLGIDLGTGADALTPSSISSATVANGVLTLNGTINAAVNEDFRVEVFANPSSAGGNVQGETPLGAFTVQTGGATSINFTKSLTTAQVHSGQVITVTITDQYGNTSEFSVGEVVS
jgi:titin